MKDEDYNEFVEYVIKNWEKRNKVTNVEKTREVINVILCLLSDYRLKCLLGTIIDVDDLYEKFERDKNKEEK